MLLSYAAAAILQLSTANGMGSACPIAADLALTAGHVIDVAPLNPQVPLFPGHWSDPTDPNARHGRFEPLQLVFGRDLALIGGEFPAWFEIAKTAPVAGDWLTIQGFDWSKKEKAFMTKTWRVRAQTRAGQMLSISDDTRPGSSGSCVLNEQGEVVGILVWSFETDSEKKAGAVVLVYGETFVKPEKPKAQDMLSTLLGGGSVDVRSELQPTPAEAQDEAPVSCHMDLVAAMESFKDTFRGLATEDQADLRFVPSGSQRAMTYLDTRSHRLVTMVNVSRLEDACPDLISLMARHEACHVRLHGERLLELNGAEINPLEMMRMEEEAGICALPSQN